MKAIESFCAKAKRDFTDTVERQTLASLDLFLNERRAYEDAALFAFRIGRAIATPIYRHRPYGPKFMDPSGYVEFINSWFDDWAYAHHYVFDHFSEKSVIPSYTGDIDATFKQHYDLLPANSTGWEKLTKTTFPDPKPYNAKAVRTHAVNVATAAINTLKDKVARKLFFLKGHEYRASVRNLNFGDSPECEIVIESEVVNFFVRVQVKAITEPTFFYQYPMTFHGVKGACSFAAIKARLKGAEPMIPANPEKVYAGKWKGWDDFLGVTK